MTHFIRNTQVKAMTSIWMAKQKARELAGRTKEGRRFAGIATVAVAAATVLLTTPAGIGLCANPDMSCHQTGLVLWVAAGIALVVGIVQAAKADPKGAELPKMKL